MNVVLDTLSSARSARWLGHLAGLLAFGALAALGPSGALAWFAAAQMAMALLGLELFFGLLDFKAMRLKALAPGAFPFKKMEPADRAFLQDALGSLPSRSVVRSVGVWVLGAALLTQVTGLSYAGAALLLSAGLPLAALAQAWMNAVMLKRVLPFFYFEQQDAYAQGLSAWLPGLSSRLLTQGLAPLLVAGAPWALMSVLGQGVGPLELALLLGLGVFTALAGRAVLQSLAVEPMRDLGLALQRLSQGGLDGLLDITDGSEPGRATEAYNRALRAVDRRLFLLEKFGHAILPGRSESVLEGLRLDGEKRPVAALSARWLDAAEALRAAEPRLRLAALSRFYEAVQDAVDRHQGCVFQLDDGAVLAVWGAPFAGDGAVRGALGAAWELQSLLPVLARQASQREGLSLRWGLGLASGQATAGLAGPRGRERYSVQGPPIDEAKSLAGRGEGTWVDERSAGAAQAPYGVQIANDGIRLIQGPQAPQPDASSLGFKPGEKL